MELSGLNHRPELNGTSAKVLEINPDTGFATVRVSQNGTRGSPANSKCMRVHASKLRQLNSAGLADASSPPLALTALPRSSSETSIRTLGQTSFGNGTFMLPELPHTPAAASMRSRSTSGFSGEEFSLDCHIYSNERARVLAAARHRQLVNGSKLGKARTDATQFATKFIETAGFPIHQQARTVMTDVPLQDLRTKQPAAPWKVYM